MSEPASFLDTSMLMAVKPVTPMLVPVTVPSRWRMLWTRSSVAVSPGPVLGMTARRAVSPAWLTAEVATAATLPRPSIFWATWAAVVLAEPAVVSTTTVSGPLKPGPKPVASRS
jgi:hypothetical protein